MCGCVKLLFYFCNSLNTYYFHLPSENMEYKSQLDNKQKGLNKITITIPLKAE